MPLRPFRLSNVATFQGLSASDLAMLEAQLMPIDVARGACIVSEGDDADALFVVVSGRFAVEIGGNPDPVTEIGQGATIGEIAFFAGGQRTATVRAIRDSVVVRLSRADFDAISARAPAIWNTITATLASSACSRDPQDNCTAHKGRRNVTPGSQTGSHISSQRPARTDRVAVIRAGGAPIPRGFLGVFRGHCQPRTPGTLVVSSRTLPDHIGRRNGRRRHNGSPQRARNTLFHNRVSSPTKH